MKHTIAAVAATAVLVLAPLGVAGTASAQTRYDNCQEAFDAGVSNIQRGEPGYRLPLDRDRDGVACEADGADGGSPSASGSGSQDETVSSSGSTRPDQVTVVPEGGAETGDGSTETGAAPLVAGGLLAAFAGAFVVRRSQAGRR
ncbi:excalibur calcium-binding domain-containing protein [Actinomycetospora termitidis]|uniref:Excalibur calcium-binding domain-containing protein n=1 Tax=Actinomycetospora termitidis TaxID=3053470 RepID=A0ABT7MBV4_9PSEU|nr:excalibur calcium-binding domain-containing protein [Actinomycetospora sp. Odt1-22]MDL5158149.1 excalibur calcium-binding domain-containing protein [Actinomycetospora sp. Odt1-22]